MTACGINGRTFSAPRSLLTSAMSAEASRTYSVKGRILPASLMQFIDQADTLGDVSADHFLRLTDGLGQGNIPELTAGYRAKATGSSSRPRSTNPPRQRRAFGGTASRK